MSGDTQKIAVPFLLSWLGYWETVVYQFSGSVPGIYSTVQSPNFPPRRYLVSIKVWLLL